MSAPGCVRQRTDLATDSVYKVVHQEQQLD
jgi:hypothetical protein